MRKTSWLVFILVLPFFVGPLLYLLSYTQFSFALALIQEESILISVRNTFFLALSVSTLSVALGLPLAWLVSRTDLPWKNRFRSWFTLPYVIPPYIGAIAWITLANPQSGILNSMTTAGFFNIYSFIGVVFVETSFLFTFVYMTCLSSLDNMDSSLEESARISGANSFKVFKDITLPLVLPSVLNGFLLVFLSTSASFGVPALVGGPARLQFLTTQIFSFQRLGTETGVLKSISLSSFLMLSSLVLFTGLQLFLGSKKYAIVTGKTARPSLISLGAARWILFSVLIFFFFILFVLPNCALLFSALSETQGVINFSSLGFKNFQRILFSTEETPRAFMNSFTLSLGSAFFITACGFFIAYVQSRSTTRLKGWIETAINLPFSTPGTVLAIAVILIFSRSFWGALSIYNTLGIIFVAYIIKYFSLSLKTLTDTFSQIHPSLEEAATLSGASKIRILFDIYLPLLTPALLSTFFLVLMPCLSELTMTLLLSGPGQETLGILIYQLQEYSDMSGGGAAVVATLILIFVFILNSLLSLIQKRRSFL